MGTRFYHHAVCGGRFTTSAEHYRPSCWTALAIKAGLRAVGGLQRLQRLRVRRGAIRVGVRYSNRHGLGYAVAHKHQQLHQLGNLLFHCFLLRLDVLFTVVLWNELSLLHDVLLCVVLWNGLQLLYDVLLCVVLWNGLQLSLLLGDGLHLRVPHRNVDPLHHRVWFFFPLGLDGRLLYRL